MRKIILMFFAITFIIGLTYFFNVKKEPVEKDEDVSLMVAVENENVTKEYECGDVDLNSIDTAAEDLKKRLAELAISNVEPNASLINFDKLYDFDYLCQNFYQIDNTTTTNSAQLNYDKLMSFEMAIDETVDGPNILIYHTHSQEGYKDSAPGDASTTVVGVGEYLKKLLEQEGFRVLHHTGEYDVGNRNRAYSKAAPDIQKILSDNPSIQVVIDLHRDGIPESTHLATEIEGRPTAKVMFFNGLCKTTSQGNLTNLANPYLDSDLALSFQLQLQAAQKYPDLTRKIYLKGYRYNMHMCPKSILVEVGAQNNTVEEAMNAMIPLEDVLSDVLR